MSEETVFSSGDVRVTTRRLVVGAKTYQLSNIASFTVVRIEPDSRGWGCLSLIGGLAALGFAIYLAVEKGLDQAANFVLTRGGWVWISGGVVALLAAWVGLYGIKDKYAVQLDTSSGSVNAIVSKNWPWIQQVAAALTEAMESRA